MPKKNNGMPYEVHRSPIKGDDGQQIVYVRPRSRQKVNMQQLDAYCAANYALRPGELTRAFRAFIDATGYYLAEGYRMETLIGSFAPKIGLRRTITDPDDVKDKDVRLEGIEYHSVKAFEENVRQWLKGFRRIDKPDTQQLMNDTEHLDNSLKTCIDRQGYVTVNQFAAVSGLTKYSARKQLDAWCQGDHPRLQKTPWGKQHIYTYI